MSATKAKHTDMMSKRWKKAKAQVEDLEGQAAQLRMSILNIRQMYEGSIGEKTVLQNRLANVEQLLTAVVVNGRGKSVTLKEKTLKGLDQYAGIDTKAQDDGSLILTALTIAEVEAMQDEIDEE